MALEVVQGAPPLAWPRLRIPGVELEAEAHVAHLAAVRQVLRDELLEAPRGQVVKEPPDLLLGVGAQLREPRPAVARAAPVALPVHL